MMSRRAVPPARAPLPFDPPVFVPAQHVTGTVWTTANIPTGDQQPSSHNSISDCHILLLPEQNVAYWLQRKIGKTAYQGSIRVGFPVKKGEEGVWELISDLEEDMVTVTIHDKKVVVPADNNGSSSPVATELSVLQWIGSSCEQDEESSSNHVMKCYWIAADHKSVFCVTPLYSGSLLEHCAPQERSSEAETRFFFLQILQGLETLERAHLCHGNLSLDTILLRGTTCEIAGLGSALRIPADDNGDGTMLHLLEPQQPRASQAQYVAPELFVAPNQQQQPLDGFAVDLWAAGVLLFVLLVGSDALFGAPVPEDRRFYEICVQYANLKQALQHWQAQTKTKFSLSDEALDLLQKMLRAQPNERLTLSQVQQHAWVQGDGSDKDVAIPTSLLNEKKPAGASSLE